MLFALEEVNSEDSNILPGVKLGARIYDTCRSQTVGSEGAKEIIKYTLREENDTSPLAGVIGPFRSDVSVAVANLLRVFNIPQVSYGSTTPVLSDKDLYGYFFRTVPSNSYQGRAMVDVVRHFGWTYVMTVYSAGEYGEKGMEKFYDEAERAGLCIAKRKKLPPFPTEEDFANTVQELLEMRKSSLNGRLDVVVLFCIQRDNEGLLRAASKILKQGIRFSWLASNSWGAREQVTHGVEEAGEGAITINYVDGIVKRFKDYFLSLNPTKYKHGPWFEEFYQSILKCTLLNSTKSNDFPRTCQPDESLPRNLGIAPVRVVINAVYAVANALNNMHKVLCAGASGLCESMRKLKREQVLEYLKNVSFPDASLNSTVSFNKNGDVDGKYNILNFKRVDHKHHYVKIGKWIGALDGTIDNIVGRLELNDTAISWGGGRLTTPESFCSERCRANQTTVPEITNPGCCWRCVGCQGDEIIVNNTCSSCKPGYVPRDDLTKCDRLPVVYPSLNDSPAQVLAVLSCGGLVASACSAVVFVVMRKHRVIKASSRELSFILFVGVVSCYIAALLHFVKPERTICGILRFSDSVSMTTCYAPVLLRTNRIYRIFKAAQRSVRRPSLVSPLSQAFVALGIISVQVLITLIWLLSSSPSVVESYIHQDYVILECSTDDFSVAINLCFNAILMLVSTVFAFKTRNFPRNFNEAKCIGITMYLSCSIWVVFLPCYFNAADSIWKSYFLCSSIFLVGTVTLLGLLAPKIFLVYFGNAIGPQVGTVTGTYTGRSDNEVPNGSLCTGPCVGETENTAIAKNSTKDILKPC